MKLLQIIIPMYLPLEEYEGKVADVNLLLVVSVGAVCLAVGIIIGLRIK
jgi:hypothetical protein